jgi:hypothetical protein
MKTAAIQAAINTRRADRIAKLSKLGTVELERRGRALAEQARTAVRGYFGDGTAECIDADLEECRIAWRRARRVELEAVAS